MEGYKHFPEANHTEAVTRMKKKIRGRNRRKNLLLYRIAATLAIILSFSILFWNINQNRINRPLSKEIPSTTNAAPEKISPDYSFTPEEDEVKKELNITTNIQDHSAGSIEVEEVPEVPINPSKVKEELAEDAFALKETKTPLTPKINPKNSEPPDSRKELLPPLPEPSAAIETLEKMEIEPIVLGDDVQTSPDTSQNIQIQELKTVYGQIRNPDGLPVIGAIVFSPSTNKSTVTDEMGRFNLTYAANSSNLTIENQAGQSSIIPLQNRDTLDLIVNLDEERQPFALRAKKDRSQARPAAPQNQDVTVPIMSVATPIGGFEAFEHYISEALKYPDEALLQRIEGRVELKFIIRKNGKVSKIEITRSLGYGCDQEAIRLLEEGPKWMLPTGYNQSIAFYSIPFRLKK